MTVEYIDPDNRTRRISKLCLIEMATQEERGEVIDIPFMNSFGCKYAFVIGCLSPNI